MCCRIGISFDHAIRKFYDQLSSVENLLDLPDDGNMGEMLPKTTLTDNFSNNQHLEMTIPDIYQLDNISNSRAFSFQKFFSNFVSSILHMGDKRDAEGVKIRMDEMTVLDIEYDEDEWQKTGDSSQDTCENARNRTFDTKMTIGVLERQYDVSIVLDYLTNTFCTDDTDFGSTESEEFSELFSDMDISKIFKGFGDLFEKYQQSIGKISGNHITNSNLQLD